jgi:hypothetical protein
MPRKQKANEGTNHKRREASRSNVSWLQQETAASAANGILCVASNIYKYLNKWL